MSGAPSRSGAEVLLHGRCRCGHYPTHHMVTRSVGTTSSFRLEPSGPCAICGEAVCKLYTPGGPAGNAA